MLQDIICAPWVNGRDRILDKNTMVEAMKFTMSLGANPRRKAFLVPPAAWGGVKPATHVAEFVTPLRSFFVNSYSEMELDMDIVEVLRRAYTPDRGDPDERCPIFATLVEGRGPTWYITNLWGTNTTNDEDPQNPRLCEFILDVNTEFAARLFENCLHRQPRWRRREYKRIMHGRQWHFPGLLQWLTFTEKLRTSRQDQGPRCKPSINVVAVSIPSLSRPGAKPLTYRIHNKSISDQLAPYIQRELFSAKPTVAGQKLALQFLPQIDRDIRSGSKDYEPLTGRLPDFLAEIDCGYCFVDQEYKRVVKRQDGSMERVDPRDWDKEARGGPGVADRGGDQGEGDLIPSLWLAGALRAFGILLWISAWLWPLRVPNIKRMHSRGQAAVGGQPVS